MNFPSIRSLFVCCAALFVGAPALSAQTPAPQPQLRSRIFIYDLRTGNSKLVYTADTIWEAPNWSPDGKYLISNSGGAIYKLVLKADGTADPQKLAIPDEYRCNNDKSLSPDGSKLAFSASLAPAKGSQVFLADADGNNVKLMVSETPSYFHGWSPDGKTLAIVADRNHTSKDDIWSIPSAGGPQKQLTSNPEHDDGPDYSPDGKWIYVNSARSGKEAIWRFPAEGAGPDDVKAEKVVDDSLQDWFPHITKDGSKLLYIGYPPDITSHGPRNAHIELKLATIAHGKVSTTQKTIVEGTGGQGTLNVNSWAPDSQRFAYVTYEPLP